MSSENKGGQPGSHAANQHKTEPMPPTEAHADPDAMNVDTNDPQTPSPDGAAGATAQPSPSDVPAEQTPVLRGTDRAPGDAGGVPVVSEHAAEGTSEESPVAQGTHTPL